MTNFKTVSSVFVSIEEKLKKINPTTDKYVEFKH